MSSPNGCVCCGDELVDDGTNDWYFCDECSHEMHSCGLCVNCCQCDEADYDEEQEEISP